MDEVAAVWFWGAMALVTALTLARRLIAGAPVAELWRSRFYEVAPLRGLLRVAGGLLWIVAAICVARLAWTGGRTAFTDAPAPEAARWIALAGAGVVTVAAAWAWGRFVVRIPDASPPRVGVDGVAISQGIGAEHYETLGAERFPNHVSGRRVRELVQRIVLGLLCLAVVVLLVVDVTTEARGGRLGLRAGAASAAKWFEAFREPRAVHAVAPAAIALLCLLWTNRSYLLLRFAAMVAVWLACSAAIVAGLGLHGASGDVLLGAGAACALAIALRCVADLRAARRHRGFRRVYDSIAATVRDEVPALPSLRGRADCELDPLPPEHIADRITRGCRVVEEADPFVTRNLARFLRLVRVEHEHFVAATLRYLTVDRYVSETGGTGTYRALQDPSVPMWNLALFPLHAPAGYRDLLDPLGLASPWDRVSICGTCGGSGRMRCSGCGGSGSVTRTESRTGSNGQSQSVSVTQTCGSCGGSGRVTCSSCGGCGRLEFGRVLNTVWKRHMPTATVPAVPMPELMEDAEERVYFRRSFVEGMRPVEEPAACAGLEPDLVQALGGSASALEARHGAHAKKVLELVGGRLYRADFQVTGHRTLRIGFERLRGRCGWFFGARPEFYWPSIPFSWAKLATAAFLPPACFHAVPVLIAWTLLWILRFDAWSS